MGPRLKVDIKVQTNRTTEGQESEAPAKPQTDKRTKLFFKHKYKQEKKLKKKDETKTQIENIKGKRKKKQKNEIYVQEQSQ